MGKIFLRRTEKDNPMIPYVIESDIKDYLMEMQTGEVSILPIFFSRDGGYVFGISRENVLGIRIPLGFSENKNDLTQKVYDSSKNYCERLSKTTPGHPAFVDETGGPREIEILSL